MIINFQIDSNDGLNVYKTYYSILVWLIYQMSWSFYLQNGSLLKFEFYLTRIIHGFSL